MNYFLDTEFYDNGSTIQLISIGIVCEDGRELYCESSQFQWGFVPKDHWIVMNVLPHLWGRPSKYNDFLKSGGIGGRMTKAEIASLLMKFASESREVRFWGYFADYDWVAFCQLFGTMTALPFWFPRYCLDLKQSMAERGLSSDWKRAVCPDPVGEHHALVDARWNRDLYNAIQSNGIACPSGTIIP